MRFGILGPLLVHDGGSVIDVPAARQRVLLAALATRPGQPLTTDELAELVWDGAPPAGATATVRAYAMRLRKVLGPLASSRLVTGYRGYLLDAAENEVDAAQFARLCADGGAAVRQRSWVAAADVLGTAQELWRGAPLADVPSEALRASEVPALERLRWQALEWQMDAGLALGRHAELVGELQSLAASQPLRERFHAQLMVALYRCGRQAEALAAYQAARTFLIDELGAEPGTELREAHQRVLDGDPDFAVAEAAPTVAVALTDSPASRSAPAVPRELPAPVGHFVGRHHELAELAGLLDLPGGRALATLMISAIGGTAGVGKTALAVHWAHQVADRFPDGQLYVNLRGYDPGQPMAAHEALAGFLRSLGVPGQDIPAEAAERATRYRTLLAGRRMLVLLDNASDAEQVRPLLPGTPGCTVVVTSRDALPGLVARDGATRIDLDLLPLSEAVRLLRELIGDRVDADHSSAVALAEQCCRLPLALRIAAELAASRPGLPLRELTAELTGHQRRLDLLDADGDLRAAVRAVFAWSYQKLDDSTARIFRLLGLHPGTEFDGYAVAELTDTTPAQAALMLDRLARASLIQPAGHGRYGMHDLLRAYSSGLTAAQDGPDARQAALTRLFDHYRATAAAAADTLHPLDHTTWDDITAPENPAVPMAEAAAAQSWLDVNRATLTEVSGFAADHGWPRHTTDLFTVLFRHLEVTGQYPDIVTIAAHAIRAAQHSGDLAAEARVHNCAAVVPMRQGRYEEAASSLLRCLARARECGHQRLEGAVLTNLGELEVVHGHYQRAASYLRQASVVWRTVNPDNEATVQEHLSRIDLRQGRYQQAASQVRRALALQRKWDNRRAEACLLTILGCVDLRLGRLLPATSHLHQALATFREMSDAAGEAEALATLGLVHLQQGGSQQATVHLQRSLALCRQYRNRAGEVAALNGLGEVCLATSQPRDAQAQFTTALGLATESDVAYEQARAHHGLGRALVAEGDPSQARGHWLQALTLYADLGTPEADDIQQLLAADHDGTGTPVVAS